MLIKLIEFIRIASCCFGIFWAYSVGMDGSDPAGGVLHIITPWVVAGIAGTSGIEGLFFGKQTEREKGFEQGSNYQKQSAFALLSYAIVSLAVYFSDWGAHAELTILLAFMFFMVFSAFNHGREAIVNNNYTWANLNRPFLTLLMIASLWYPVWYSLFP